MIRVRPIVPLDYDKLKETVEADGHVLYFPTHVVEKQGEFVGYLSLANIPMCLVWMNTKAAKVIDSVQTLNIFENLARANGAPALAVPCDKASPFYDYMAKFGFTNLSNMSLFVKNLQ